MWLKEMLCNRRHAEFCCLSFYKLHFDALWKNSWPTFSLGKICWDVRDDGEIAWSHSRKTWNEYDLVLENFCDSLP